MRQRDEAIETAEKLDISLQRLKVQMKSNEWVQEQNRKISKERIDESR